MNGQPDVILHHYDVSPFSEKVRLIFGLKGIPWKSVQIPSMMPKPDLMPLTGGYRKTPVMQVGADIYCDTQIIGRELERRFPQPTLFPGGEGVHAAIAMWADRTWFPVCATLVFGVICDSVPDEFLADRQAFSGRSVDRARLKEAVSPMRHQWRAYLGWVASALADGRPFLLGTACGLADISAYMNVWFLRRVCQPEAGLISEYPTVAPWAERVAGLGAGQRTELTAREALGVAAAATPSVVEAADPDDTGGLKPGVRVRITPDDTGRDPVEGVLAAIDAQTVVIRRRDTRVGDLAQHFPKAGFLIQSVS